MYACTLWQSFSSYTTQPITRECPAAFALQDQHPQSLQQHAASAQHASEAKRRTQLMARVQQALHKGPSGRSSTAPLALPDATAAAGASSQGTQAAAALAGLLPDALAGQAHDLVKLGPPRAPNEDERSGTLQVMGTQHADLSGRELTSILELTRHVSKACHSQQRCMVPCHMHAACLLN